MQPASERWAPQAKLCDMGLAKFCIGKTYTVCGTPEYMAPEVRPSFRVG